MIRREPDEARPSLGQELMTNVETVEQSAKPPHRDAPRGNPTVASNTGR